MNVTHVESTPKARRFVLIKWHRDNSSEVVAIGSRSANSVIEARQQQLRECYGSSKDTLGRGFGCTWQVHEGDIVSALIASEKL